MLSDKVTGGSVKKKLKIIEDNIVITFKNEPSDKNNKLLKMKPVCKNIRSIEEKPLFEKNELIKVDSLCENIESIKKKTVSEEKPSCGNIELFKGSCNSIDESSQNYDKMYNTNKFFDINKQNSNENKFANTTKLDFGDDYKVEKYDDNQKSILDREIEPEIKYADERKVKLDSKTNSKERTSKEFTKYNDYNNKCTESQNIHDSIDIDNDEIYDLLDKAYYEKKHNLSKNKRTKNTNKIDDFNYTTNSNEKTSEELTKYNGNNNESTYESINTSTKNDEIYDLLDKAYNEKKCNPSINTITMVTKNENQECKITVLENKYINHFDILPANWIQTTHMNGMPIYLHKPSGVVTLSKPYLLGTGDLKSHLPPLSAIGCLQHKKDAETNVNLKNESDIEISTLRDMMAIPGTEMETAKENTVKPSLTHDEFRKYCQSLFKYKVRKLLSEKTHTEIVESDIRLLGEETREAEAATKPQQYGYPTSRETSPDCSEQIEG